MKNILVLTDFSNNAYSALYYATELFKKVSCTFYLLNTFTDKTPLQSNSWAVGGKGSLLEQLADESREGLNAVFHKINLDGYNEVHKYELLAEKGHFLETVLQQINEKDIDLIVMGTRGITKTKQLLWGSNALKIIQGVQQCPVLSIPNEIDYQPLCEIAFASDYNTSYDAEILEPLLFITKQCSAAIRIVHINEEGRLSETQKSNLNILKKYLGKTPHTVHWMPDFASKTTAIKTFLEELGIGMLSMVHYEHGFLSSLIREPVIEQLSVNLNTPFLILPSHN